MESIGELLHRDAKGEHGRIKRVIKQHFSTSEKQMVTDNINSISQFYKAMKCRKRPDDDANDDDKPTSQGSSPPLRFSTRLSATTMGEDELQAEFRNQPEILLSSDDDHDSESSEEDEDDDES